MTGLIPIVANSAKGLSLCTLCECLVGSLGLAEVLAGNAARQEDIAALQREDLALLGQLMLQLLCGSLQHPSLEQCSVYFSRELTQIVASLIGLSQDPIISWPQVSQLSLTYV